MQKKKVLGVGYIVQMCKKMIFAVMHNLAHPKMMR
jgi:hypothetical protein